MLRRWHHWCLVCLMGLAATGAGAEPDTVAPQLPPAVLIRIGREGRPEVVPVSQSQLDKLPQGRGLLVSVQGQVESARVLGVKGRADDTLDALAAVSRSRDDDNRGGDAETGAALLPAFALDQLTGQTVVRGLALVTPPPGGYLLNPRPTIRRRPSDAASHYPAATFKLREGDRTLLEIPFKQGQATIAWADIPGLPAAYAGGLPPGQYAIVPATGGETTFTVEPEALRQWVMETLQPLDKLLGTDHHPLYLEVAVGHLLAQVNDEGRPRPYLADALDLLETADDQILTPHLASIRRELLARLAGTSSGKAGDADDAPGIARIDAARRLLTAGKWTAALAELQSPELPATPRAQALAMLYRAVILAESSPTSDAEARTLFQTALGRLAGNRGDLFRGQNNYANFLSARVQDRLYNHAFQIAAGDPCPLIRALLDWRKALAAYQAAQALAAELKPADRAAVQVNLARLYAVLADVILTLDPPRPVGRGFAEGERSAAEYAGQLAAAALEADASARDDLSQAAAHEILAQLALRREDLKTCRRHAKQAIADYLQCGSLAGVESGYRLLGILSQSEAAAGAPTEKAGHNGEALRQLLISNFLAEFLRQQVPADRIGRSRSGFFARRAYVNERIAELLIAEGRNTEALAYVEAAKARALEDVLAAGGASAQSSPIRPRDVPEILASWPKEIAALEYFLGSRRAWLFVVRTSGQVSCHLLTDAGGRPLETAELTARIKDFLVDTDHQAEVMRQRLAARQGFDSRWQERPPYVLPGAPARRCCRGIASRADRAGDPPWPAALFSHGRAGDQSRPEPTRGGRNG